MIAPIAVRIHCHSNQKVFHWSSKNKTKRKHAVVRFFKRNFSNSFAVSRCIRNAIQIKKMKARDIVVTRIYQFMKLIHDCSISLVFWTSSKLIMKWTTAKAISIHKMIFLRWFFKNSCNFFIIKKAHKNKMCAFGPPSLIRAVEEGTTESWYLIDFYDGNSREDLIGSRRSASSSRVIAAQVLLWYESSIRKVAELQVLIFSHGSVPIHRLSLHRMPELLQCSLVCCTSGFW